MSWAFQIFLCSHCYLLQKALQSGLMTYGKEYIPLSVPSWGTPRAAGLTTPLLSCCPLPEPPWCLYTTLEKMISSDLRLLQQTPGSICARSPSRNVWAFLPASSGATVSFPTPGACCPSRCPSPLWVSTRLQGRKLRSAVGAAEASPLACVSPLPAVGHPILVPQSLSLTQEEVDHYHMLYMKVLEQLSEEHKESYGVPAAMHLTFM